ncbi:nucleotide triphosphate diphosphatase NUDT15 [Aspergillus lucknowensis]|uniref:NUDIX hydrolase domain-like protein n=1 Tax=Aspergillus lucknowensis TaxID=176173 RepID=A0ABR4M600_9EURO
MSNQNTRVDVRVGVGVFALNSENKFIVGKRKGSHGADTWGLPGGHLEFNESFEECAVRELKEETGLDVYDVRFLTATNDVMPADEKHYVTVFVGARVKDGQKPQVCSSLSAVRFLISELGCVLTRDS